MRRTLGRIAPPRGRKSGAGRGSAHQQTQPQLCLLTGPLGTPGGASGPGDPDDVGGEPLSVGVDEATVQMGSGELFMHDV